MSIMVHMGQYSNNFARKGFLPIGTDTRVVTIADPNRVRYPSPVAGKIRNVTAVFENPNPSNPVLRILVNGATALAGPLAASSPAGTPLQLPGEGTVPEGAFIGVEVDGTVDDCPLPVKVAVSYVLEEVFP